MNVTIDRIHKEIRKIDKNIKPDSDEFKVATILLSSAQVGSSPRALSKFTGLDCVGSEHWIMRNLQRNRVFLKNGEVHHSGWFSKDGGIAFWMDVAIGMGWLKRV